jgi:hypothetical protein
MTTQNRAACRLGYPKCDPANLAERVHCVARHSAIDAHAISERLGCSYDWFIKVTADGGRAAAPAWLLLALAVVTGRTDHLAYLAHEAGLLTFSPAIGPGHTPALSPLVRQFARVVEQHEQMYADGVSDRDEATRYTHACAEFSALVLASANEARQAAGLPCLSTLSQQEPA